MQIEHKKNTAYYLAFPMIDSATPASFKAGVSPVDTAYYKDGAGAWTSLAITDTASEIASTGVYEIDLTAAELNHDQVIIKFAVSGAADTAFLFDMRTELAEDLGNGSGQVSLLTATQASVDAIETDTTTDIPALIATAQADLDTITGTDGVTLATAQALYAPNVVVPPAASIFTGMTSLTEWLGAMAGKQASDATAQTEMRATGAGAGTYDATTDSLESSQAEHDNTQTNIAALNNFNPSLDEVALVALVGEVTNLTNLPAAAQTSIDNIEADTNELQGDWVNAGRLDTILDAIKAVTDQMVFTVVNKLDTNPTITAAVANLVADHVRRRTQANVEASSDGDALAIASLYGLIQQSQESNTTDNANKITVYKTDGITELAQLTIVSDPLAEPLTGVS